MKRYRVKISKHGHARMEPHKTGRYVRFKDVAHLLADFETHQQYSNSNPSCPCCDEYDHMGGHHPTCELGLLLKEAGINQMKVRDKP